MKRLFPLLLLLLIPLVVADVSDLISQAESVSGQRLPGFADKLFGNERINILVGDQSASVVTVNGVVQELQVGFVSDPTLNVYTSEETIESIANSDNPLAAFQQAMDNSSIRIEAIGLWKKIKFGLLKFFVGFA